MCYTANCLICKKITWNGCGNHLENLKKQVPINMRCTCKSWD